MKTFSRVWQYLAQYVGEREVFWTKVVRKIRKTYFYGFMFSTFFSKSVVEPEGPQMTSQYGARVACWISKATRSHAHAYVHAPGHPPPPTHKYIILTVFTRQQWYANAPQCYVIHTLSVLVFWAFSVKSFGEKKCFLGVLLYGLIFRNVTHNILVTSCIRFADCHYSRFLCHFLSVMCI